VHSAGIMVTRGVILRFSPHDVSMWPRQVKVVGIGAPQYLKIGHICSFGPSWATEFTDCDEIWNGIVHHESTLSCQI